MATPNEAQSKFNVLFETISGPFDSIHDRLDSALQSALEIHNLWVQLSVNAVSTTIDYRDKKYILFNLNNKSIRPIRKDLFVSDTNMLVNILNTYNRHKRIKRIEYINMFLYSIQQSINALSDVFQGSNRSRKRVGMWFEVLVAATLAKVGAIGSCHLDVGHQLTIPFGDGANSHVAKYEIDIALFSNHAAKSVVPNALITVKTTTKDRLDKVFMDQLVATYYYGGTPIKTYGVFLHDIQLKNTKRGPSVQTTFKLGHFLLFKEIFNYNSTIYFLDIPILDNINTEEVGIKSFGELVDMLYSKHPC